MSLVTSDGLVLAVISRVLGVPLDQLSEDAGQDTLSRWDSLRHVRLILALEEEFGITVPDEHVGDLDTVRAVIAAVRRLRSVPCTSQSSLST